ncbi:hypothetical protein PV04_10323 [Phialophora macrospora]|uniref:Amidohydrolase-related domain-containing protein n=1 Tax=Phialophora macrospora TaxID=1851006 RepID=A0A0D2CEI2_9EURO|nr:hypothetical protein PV04_10323 [Phialophora macrospora]
MLKSCSTLALLCLLGAQGPVHACLFHAEGSAPIDFASVAAANNKFREENSHNAKSHTKIAINNVRVFDGYKLLPPSTVVIDGDVIGHDPSGAEQTIDGNGGVMLPGLMDTHCHPSNITHLQELTRWGVSTAMVMACYFPEACHSLQNQTTLTDVVLGSVPASTPGSANGNLTQSVNPSPNVLVANESQAVPWVDSQVAWGADFIKLIADTPGLDQPTLDALVSESHRLQKRVVCHATSLSAYEQAVTAQVNQIYHAPLDKPINSTLIATILQQGQISAPTLTIMQAFAQLLGTDYTVARETVTLLHAAGVPILAGTDANHQAGIPVQPPFGSSLHLELELLVDAGLSPAEALRAATSRAAAHWGLKDRGVIAPGMRADLLLIDGNPLQNISATRNIQKIWLKGVEYTGPLADAST